MLHFRGSRKKSQDHLHKSASTRRPTTFNNDRKYYGGARGNQEALWKAGLDFCESPPRVSVVEVPEGQRLSASEMAGEGRHFLFNPLCSDGNAGGRFNASSRYCFHISGCKLTERANGSVVRGSARHDLPCVKTKRTSQPSCCFMKKHTRAEIGVINAVFHILQLHCSTQRERERERENTTYSNLCRRLRGVAETRGVKVRSNFFAAPQLCAQTCWDLQGAVSLCFVSLLLRHSCAQRPGKFHRLSEPDGSSGTHRRRAFGGIRSYYFRNYKIGLVEANHHFKFLSQELF